MRRIGTLSNEDDARRFAEYLYAQDVRTRVDQASEHWEIWALDEDRVDVARRELDEFRAAPHAEKYAAATRDAEQKRNAELRQAIQARKQRVNLRERWDRPPLLQVPVTIALIGACIAVTLMCGFGRNDELTSRLQIQQWEEYDMKPSGRGWIAYSPVLLNEVREGEVWRLITPIFLHFSPWHLFGNLMCMSFLGGMIENRQGSLSLVLKVLLIGVVSNVVQYLIAGPSFGGISGVVFGLFGYAWIKGQFDAGDGIGVSGQSATYFLVWMVLCSTGLIGNVANGAHSAGLIMGILLAAPAAVRQWLR
jgi:GlpG protein